MHARVGKPRDHGPTFRPAQPITQPDPRNQRFTARLPPKGSTNCFDVFKVIGSRLLATIVTFFHLHYGTRISGVPVG